MPIDPVCKRHVRIADAAASYDLEGETLYFCTLRCEKIFEKDPYGFFRNMTDEELIAA
ncbi:MAG TPA: YHS domain-containing protein [Candidatus Angelobacter sp.]|nr:YHS domain-containing protein [Candidatus Angelobacter sp.]